MNDSAHAIRREQEKRLAAQLFGQLPPYLVAVKRSPVSYCAHVLRD
jgi:hypothetical protein